VSLSKDTSGDCSSGVRLTLISLQFFIVVFIQSLFTWKIAYNLEHHGLDRGSILHTLVIITHSVGNLRNKQEPIIWWSSFLHHHKSCIHQFSHCSLFISSCTYSQDPDLKEMSF
jgi:hypothetical protein